MTKQSSRQARNRKENAGADSEVTSIKLGSIATYAAQGREGEAAGTYNLGFAKTLPGNYT